ncbi:MAG: PD-(D/E)XK nuclease family protein [Solirubrobacterales bacterium]|nr:PD-(D/E)XK nuclease family protein [Solirubrobacterales bacterium]
MPLTIIKGPPNSGRTEQVRQLYMDRLREGKDPVLVVPSTDDIFTWEERLTRGDQGALLGGRVMHFKDLIGAILGRDPLERTGIAGPLRRRALAAESIRRGWPAIANRLERQPGLIDAALRAFDDLRAGRIFPDAFRVQADSVDSADSPEEDGPASPDGSVLERIGEMFAAYTSSLAELGLKDEAALAAEASVSALDHWQGRPVFLAGFDDLTEVQLELLVRLAKETTVTIAITHEDDSPAMAVTDLLLSRLPEHGDANQPRDRLDGREAGREPLLNEIERRFLRRLPDATPLSPDRSLTLIEASGTRGEAEAVGAEIARLVSTGVTPDEIAIAVNSPAVNGRVFHDVLREYGIASTLECETAATGTAVGQTVIALLRAAGPSGRTEDLLRFLRGPVGTDPGMVDRTELRCVRASVTDAREAAEIFRRVCGNRVPFLEAARGHDPGQAVLDLLETVVASLLGSTDPDLPGPDVATETQMTTAIHQAVEELQTIHGERLGRGHILDALTSGTVSTWAVPAGNTVRIASPYSLRAKRVRRLFMVSLQERDPGASDRSDGPFLNKGVRGAIGMEDPNPPEDQERYLFHSCLSVPTEGLCISCRIADDNGSPEHPSPLIQAVTDLFRSPEEIESDEEGRRHPGLTVIRRVSSDIIFPPAVAPSKHELTRSLTAQAAVGVAPDAGLPELPVKDAVAQIADAGIIDEQTRALSDLNDPEVLEKLRGRNTFSPTGLESFTGCPYRWFIERELGLQRFGPEPEALARGNIVHQALQTIYSGRPGQRPREDSLDQWLSAVAPAVAEAAEAAGLTEERRSASSEVMLRRAVADISTQIRLEAGFESPLVPKLLEASFGREGSREEALQFEDWQLVGTIDRVDTTPDGRGVVIDYKTGNGSVKTWKKIVSGRRLQLQLYLKAVRELWKIDPLAGLYLPVCNGKRQPRGPIEEEDFGEIAGIRTVGKDKTDLEDAIAEATGLADQAVAEIRSGLIAHDPLTCPDHFHHPAVPDWRPESDNPEGDG